MFHLLKKRASLLVVIITLSTIISSCSSGTVFNQNFDLPESGWYKSNAVKFNIDITDSLKPYDFGISIRNNIDYRYSNLYIFLRTEFPNGNISNDTIEFIIANEEGKWLGKGWGDVKENNILLKSNLRFPLTGNYKFLIQQAMRVDTLKGLQSIGLSVMENNSN